MTSYALTPSGYILRVDGAYIPPDPANSDYAAYLEWVAAGNTASPPTAAPPPTETPDLSAQVSELQAQVAELQAQVQTLQSGG